MGGEITINWYAIILCMLLSLAIGSAWYSKMFFGEFWMKSWGLTKTDLKKGSVLAIGSATLFAFLMAFILRHMIVFTQHFYNLEGLGAGLMTAFWIWLGFVLPALGTLYFFSRRSIKVLAVDSGNLLLTLILMGGILGAWV